MKQSGFYNYLTVEDKEHIRVVDWLTVNLKEDIIWIHYPSEGKRSPFERWKASIMGLTKGVVDFIFLHPKYSPIKKDSSGAQYRDLIYLGLVIELKAPEYKRIVQKGPKTGKVVKAVGKLSPEQEKFLARANKQKYRAVCHWGAEDAIEEIKKYFN